MSATVSTHVLDARVGAPARGLAVRLEPCGPGGAPLAEGRTDGDGRLRDWHDPAAVDPGDFRLVFDTGGYFAALGVAAFYPEVAVAFTVTEAGGHYHVPLLLSPFAYSTYRGS
ncbi:hydroxyisourate hydrolase [Allonocardiopsis opalescens]|uniref:5-hydroxyisourate hydrolase n=1 Tax=Allonocardiopsis opalescens TaxID=1144618 RepID=A0A2T0QCI7_9ACTN|nr:hydroxyisourate hydrolase [Allonocardiopsis opalescens]PRY01664.1 5-hydroxyisourate hydrolase [Allonocardiopsis opalescens]